MAERGIMNRRNFFQGITAASAALPGGQRIASAMAARTAQDAMKVYTRIGLRPIINAAGTYTHLGGSLIPQEVLEAMNDAAQSYVPIRDLSKAVVERIAELTANPAALVTTGAAGPLFTGSCACIARRYPHHANPLPFTPSMKNQL